MDEDLTNSLNEWFKIKMLRTHRIRAGITQAVVAEHIDRSIDSYRVYEQGKTPIPYTCIDPFAEITGMRDDIRQYMKIIGKSRKRGQPLEADMRFNALLLSLGEQYHGEIFKWDSILFPGLLQTEGYHNGPVRKSETNANDASMRSGWEFKTERRVTLRARTDRPKVHYLIGEPAFNMLAKEPRKLQIEQLDYLTACDRIPGWQIRVLTEPWESGQAKFDLYLPGKSLDAGPAFVYTEVFDSSWCIPDTSRIAKYDKWRRTRWPRSIRFKEYRDGFWRDRLA